MMRRYISSHACIALCLCIICFITYLVITSKDDENPRTMAKTQKSFFHRITAGSSVNTPSQQPHFSMLTVHFDLKGAPPKLAYYDKILPYLSQLGVNSILMEYEDMFPYTGSLSKLAALNSYKKKDILYLQKLARQNGIEIIPLIQTFGHVEFALKGHKFASLRELENYPNMMCPSKSGSMELVQQMVDQVMKLHKDARYVHIGCDETWQLGQCSLCKRKMSEAQWDETDLFLDHVTRVASYVKKMYKVEVLVWDDMFRTAPAHKLTTWRVGSLVQPVVWNYHAYNFESGLPTWSDYQAVFPHVWAASAFKGATASDALVTNITHHVGNHLNWLRVFSAHQAEWSAGGGTFDKIILTGWQRYNHFAGLCELLPVSLPSLAVCLTVLKAGKWEPREMLPGIERSLGIPVGGLALEDHPRECQHGNMYMTPTFPGGRVFVSVREWCTLSTALHDLFTLPPVASWAGPYNRRHNYSSPYILEQSVVPLIQKYDLGGEVAALVRSLNDSLSEVYDGHTVTEWFVSNVNDVKRRFDEISSGAETMTRRKFWPRQPVGAKRGANR